MLFKSNDGAKIQKIFPNQKQKTKNHQNNSNMNI